MYLKSNIGQLMSIITNLRFNRHINVTVLRCPIIYNISYGWKNVTKCPSGREADMPVSIQSEVLSETRLFQDLVNQQLACLERLKGAAAKLPDSWYSTEDGQKQLESLKETLLRDYFHEFDALRKNLKDQQDQKRKETLEKLR